MPEMFKIEKPNLSGIDAQKLLPLFTDEQVRLSLDATVSPSYLPWADVRHRPLPSGVSREEFWYLAKLSRQIQRISTFIRDASGKYYSWIRLERFNRFLHEIDMRAGGNLFVSEGRLSELGKNADSYVTRGIIEEAIASSQLEGAHTTHRVAKNMIREGRQPKNKDEQMIYNNYLAIQKIRDVYQKENMSRELMLALHRLLTENTDVESADVGRFRIDSDEIVVADDQYIGHIPPKEAFVTSELDSFFKIANDEVESASFLHPIVKAIFLHFWIGYLHPFADGNGRFARAIFYWYLLRHGYWAMMYLPISVMIKKSPIQYRNAYIYSEQDDLDLTYFVDYHIRVIELAIRDFNQYIEDKYQANRSLGEKLGQHVNLNERQKSLLIFLAKHPDEQITIKNFQAHNDISLLTARHDLYDLSDRGYLDINKVSDHFVIFTASNMTRSLGM